MDKVLVVDDNEQSCEILTDVLSTWGYKVYQAYQGMEAFEFANKYHPDIILLDVMLPGMNGFEVCKRLKNNPLTKDIPIIMLTVLTDVEDRIRGFNVGADIFLSKPINYNELRNRIVSLINKHKQFYRMEHQDLLVKSFLEILKNKSNKLYMHSCKVKEYCEKVANLVGVTDYKLEQLLIGAYLHDIGKIISEASLEHVEVGTEIVSPLKMSKWLHKFIRNHHEKLNGKGYPDGLKEHQMPLELQILITVNRFIELWELMGEKETSISTLEKETKQGSWSTDVLNALKQVIEDEKFLEHFNM